MAFFSSTCFHDSEFLYFAAAVAQNIGTYKSIGIFSWMFFRALTEKVK